MNELQKKMAEIEGYSEESFLIKDSKLYGINPCEFLIGECPTYNNREDILRVVGLLKIYERINFVKALMKIMGQDVGDFGYYDPIEVAFMLEATAEQMKQALAKALGVEG